MANFTSTISESVLLNGSNRGSNNTIVIEDITHVAEKIMECPARAGGASTIIGNWASSTNPTGVVYQNYNFNDTEYIRVTNTDELNHCEVAFVTTDTDNQCVPGKSASNCRFKLGPLNSVVMWQTSRGVKGASTKPNFAISLADLSYIEIWNPSVGETPTSINIELFTASKK